MIGWLRDARWLTERRAAAIGAVLALPAAFFVAAGALRMVWPGMAPGPTDFLSFFAASALALSGEPAAAWEPARHAAAQAAIVQAGYLAFFYPPNFLLICLPLALLSYSQAFLAWVAVTGALCFAALLPYRAAPWPVVLLLCLCAPAAMQNFYLGQNGFLTTALFAMAGLAVERRPALAGAILASLSFKPHLGILVLPGLIAARRWAVLAAGMAAGLAWILTSALVLGWESWGAFLGTVPRAGAALREGDIRYEVFQSVFGMLRAAGVPNGPSQVAQAIVSVATVVLVFVQARRCNDMQACVVVMAAGAALVTPFVLVYDMTALLLPTVWLMARGRAGGFLPWEKAGLVAVILLPALAIWFAGSFGLSLGPVAPLIALLLVLRRAGQP